MIDGQVFFDLPPVASVAGRITAGDQSRYHIRRMASVRRVMTSPSLDTPPGGRPT